MSDEPFLARWSRRKREAEEVEKTAPNKAADASAPDSAQGSPDAPGAANESAQSARKTEAPFDVASLPPIEEIGVGTDIRAFLAAGVPAEIKRAALRRVWVADPSIRDFVGLAENDWDFTKPDSMRGFGALPADFDVEAMVRGVFGDAPKTAAEESPQAQPGARQDAEVVPQEQIAALPQPAPEAADQSAGTAGGDDGQSGSATLPPGAADLPKDIVQRESFAATQTKMTLSNPDQPQPRRLHGGALPRDIPKTKVDS
jgi:hypothetical protein